MGQNSHVGYSTFRIHLPGAACLQNSKHYSDMWEPNPTCEAVPTNCMVLLGICSHIRPKSKRIRSSGHKQASQTSDAVMNDKELLTGRCHQRTVHHGNSLPSSPTPNFLRCLSLTEPRLNVEILVCKSIFETVNPREVISKYWSSLGPN